MIHFNGKSYYIKKFKYFENLLKILDDSISKMPTNITFVYNDKVIKVFLHKKYFVRYLYNYENFTNYNKITIKK
ncbi:MAG: hypothetical protein LBQ24_02250 [Candidatus Peribacteria bacterium]|jgi:hypothetical protein|nr:hypothetical protein [Candidatus Peribacteria bacterium]